MAGYVLATAIYRWSIYWLSMVVMELEDLGLRSRSWRSSTEQDFVHTFSMGTCGRNRTTQWLVPGV